jgi:hypothetical protein
MSEPEGAGNEISEWQPPSEEEIRRRAYEIYVEREQECGGPIDDWLEAEAELLLRRNPHCDAPPRSG